MVRDVAELYLALAFQPWGHRGLTCPSLDLGWTTGATCSPCGILLGGTGALQDPQLQVDIADVLHLALEAYKC